MNKIKNNLLFVLQHLRAAQEQIENDENLYKRLDDIMNEVNDLIEEVD